MAGIRFFERSIIDRANDTSGFALTVADGVATDTGQALGSYLIDRRNWTGWVTTGSADAGNTTLTIEFDQRFFDTIILVNHNFKNYTVQYWDGANYVNFSTTVNVSNFAKDTSFHQFTEVETDRIRIVVSAAQVVDADKFLSQLIITTQLGQFQNNWVISESMSSINKSLSKTVSGLSWVSTKQGAFEMDVSSQHVINDNDLSLIETINYLPEGFLVWPCGGDETQFRTERVGFRLRDIFYMVKTSELNPVWANGIYNQGTNIKFNLREAK
jgi:hypothetical protein